MKILQKSKKAAMTLLMALPMTVMAQQNAAPLPLDPQVRYGHLENGLTYYIRHNEEPRERVNFYIAQKVGSVQEEESQRGLAHFLEHMCFNGTKHFPGNKIVSYCESIGVKFGQNLNAYTSTDETVYNINDVPSKVSSNIDSCLLILRDWSDGLLLETEEIDKERGVIHEEWRMRSSATMRILNRNLEALYPGSRYGKRMTIGLMSVVDNFAPAELRAYYEKWYRPDLQAIIVVGDIDVDDIEKRIKETFSTIEMPENAAPFEYYDVPDNNEPIYIVDKDPELKAAQIYLSFKMAAMTPEENATIAYYVNSFVGTSISNALNTRFAELAQKDGCPFAYAGCSYGYYLLSKTKKEFGVNVVPKPGKDAEALEAAMREIERARRHGITGTELFRARQSIMSSVESLYNNRDKQKNIYYNNEYKTHFLRGCATPGIETEYEIFKMLNEKLPDEIITRAYAESVASTDTNFVVLALYPEKEGQTIPTKEELQKAIDNARKAELEPYVDNVKNEPLIDPMPRKGKITKEEQSTFGYTKLTLSNGVNVYYKQTDFNNSEVMMTAESFGGLARIDGNSKEDIATTKVFENIFESTGMGNFTATELRKALAGKQVSLHLALSSKSETISGGSTPKDLRTLFELTHLAFKEPADDPDGYNSAISTLKISVENNDKDPMTAFYDSIYSTITDRPEYINTLKKTDIEKVSYDRYKKIYKERFHSAGDFNFYFTGAFDVDSLKLYAEQYIASLPGIKRREEYKPEPYKYVKGINDNCFKREMETPQAYAFQLWSGERDYSVKNDIIMDFASSILRMRYTKTIREEAGLAYSISVSGSVSSSRNKMYTMQIICPFTPAKVDSVLLLVRESIDDIAENGVTEDELENVRKFEKKDFADKQRKNQYWHNSSKSDTFWGTDIRKDYDTILETISSEDIQDFVKNVILKDNNCTTVIMLPQDLTERE